MCPTLRKCRAHRYPLMGLEAHATSPCLSTPMKERVYTEEEVAALIERTAELQAEKKQHGGPRSGLTLTELEAVASNDEQARTIAGVLVSDGLGHLARRVVGE